MQETSVPSKPPLFYKTQIKVSIYMQVCFVCFTKCCFTWLDCQPATYFAMFSLSARTVSNCACNVSLKVIFVCYSVFACRIITIAFVQLQQQSSRASISKVLCVYVFLILKSLPCSLMPLQLSANWNDLNTVLLKWPFVCWSTHGSYEEPHVDLFGLPNFTHWLR